MEKTVTILVENIKAGEELENAFIHDSGKKASGHVNVKLVNSKEYHDKFVGLSGSKLVDESLYKECLKLLDENNDTEFEHLVAVDARTGSRLFKNRDAAYFGVKHACGFSVSQSTFLANRTTMFEGIHNHPNSSIPSRDDIQKLFERDKQKASNICCHDGTIFRLEKLREYREIDRLVETIYHTIKQEFQGYRDDKIEYECSMKIISILVEQGYLAYEER